jgi:hypothetical protein
MKTLFALGACALVAVAPVAIAKPIAFARGKTVMAEFGGGTMNEFQAFYAPTYWSSVGVGWTELTSDIDGTRHQYVYLRGNLLAHRWNLPGAQANVFAWGGLGNATGSDFAGSELSREVGVQADYETRRVYASFKSDLQESAHTSHRIDTLQLGWAPYAHDYDTLATWIVVQGRTYTGDIRQGTEGALLLRLFKGGTWVEVGATTDRELQAMVMFNF